MNELNEFNKRHGYWEYSYFKGYYINGKHDGYWQHFYDDKKQKKYSEGIYKNDRNIGYWKCYDYNGNLSEKMFYL